MGCEWGVITFTSAQALLIKRQRTNVLPVRSYVGQLHVSKPTWWLESRFHFSFADWYHPGKNNFGALRASHRWADVHPTLSSAKV